jgi:Tfp pilus assembly protein PilN
VDPYLAVNVERACEEWRSVLERLEKERGMTLSTDLGRDDHYLVDLASELEEDLRTIRLEQQSADLLRDTQEQMKAENHTEDQIRDATAKMQAKADELHDEVSAILKSPITVRQLERLLAFIQASEDAQ